MIDKRFELQILKKYIKIKEEIKMRKIKKLIRKYKYKLQIKLSDRKDRNRIKTLFKEWYQKRVKVWVLGIYIWFKGLCYRVSVVGFLHIIILLITSIFITTATNININSTWSNKAPNRITNIRISLPIRIFLAFI